MKKVEELPLFEEILIIISSYRWWECILSFASKSCFGWVLGVQLLLKIEFIVFILHTYLIKRMWSKFLFKYVELSTQDCDNPLTKMEAFWGNMQSSLPPWPSWPRHTVFFNWRADGWWIERLLNQFLQIGDGVQLWCGCLSSLSGIPPPKLSSI